MASFSTRFRTAIYTLLVIAGSFAAIGVFRFMTGTACMDPAAMERTGYEIGYWIGYNLAIPLVVIVGAILLWRLLHAHDRAS